MAEGRLYSISGQIDGRMRNLVKNDSVKIITNFFIPTLYLCYKRLIFFSCLAEDAQDPLRGPVHQEDDGEEGPADEEPHQAAQAAGEVPDVVGVKFRLSEEAGSLHVQVEGGGPGPGPVGLLSAVLHHGECPEQ